MKIFLFKTPSACPAHKSAQEGAAGQRQGCQLLPRGCSLADTPVGYKCSLPVQGGLALPSPGAGHDGNLSKKKSWEWYLAQVSHVGHVFL